MMPISTRVRLITVTLFIALPGLANAQVATIPGVSQSGTVPTGFQAQGFKLDCNNATPTSGQCWPLMEIWDGTNQATVDATSHGLKVFLAGGATGVVNSNLAPGDAITTTAYGPASPTIGNSLLWNGTTYDRQAEAAGSLGVASVNVPSPYPANAVPITASATGTTGATTATLTNVTSHTTYICGFSIRANAAAAATGNATVTGTKTGTLNFTQWTAVNTSGLGVTEEVFSPCIPASAVSTSIAVVSAAPGTSGVVSVSAWGYSI